jgi:transcriptional regulator with XRE-family HTH domain
VEAGRRIRMLRRTQRRTLQDVADKAAITKSLLSKIENGKTMPPIATLTRIANALGTSMTSLLSQGDQRGPIFIPADETYKTTETNKGYSFFSFANQRSSKLMQLYMFTAKKGKIIPQALSHPGEEFIYILKGRMRCKVGDIQYTLKPGDSLYFDSEEDHDLDPISAEVKYIAVFCDRPRR